MVRQPVRLVVTVLILAAAAGGRVTAQDSDAQQQVQLALQQMHAWVGEDANGKRWKEFLHSEALQSQVQRGDAADRAVLEEILGIYQSDTPGLNHRRFTAVREALKEWIASLPVSEDQLPELARRWKDQFRPVPEAAVQQRKAALQAALARLENYFAPGDPQNWSRWKVYLHWDAMQQQLAGEAKPDLAVLQRSLNALYENHQGLEMEYFTDVRQALRGYMNASLFHGEPRAEEVYERRIDELAGRLQEVQADWQQDQSVMIGRLVGWLESGDQAQGLVQAVRAAYTEPNLYALVSDALVSAAVRDEVQETTGVNEVILGTTLQGTAHMTGSLDMDVVPNDQRAEFEIVLEGTAYSDNVGYNGPVTIYSSGTTGLHASKRVFLGPEGFEWNRAWANGWTSSTINSIAARNHLIRKIAWKRVFASKPQAERIAAQRAASRVAGRVDTEAATLLEQANNDYLEKVRRPLLRRDAFPQMHLQTTADALRLRLTHATRYQLAAPSQAPEIEPGHDLSVRLHETLVGNMSESLLGGVTLTDERLADLMSEAGAEVPEELQIGPDKDPWSITFSSELPVTAAFDGDEIRIALRGSRFTRRDQEIREQIQIAARYRLESAGVGSRLTRVGDVEVDYLNRTRLSVSQVAMKSFLRTKFEALFKTEIVSDGLVLPGRWQKVGTLALRNLAAQEGWLSLDWNIPDDTVRTARAD